MWIRLESGNKYLHVVGERYTRPVIVVICERAGVVVETNPMSPTSEFGRHNHHRTTTPEVECRVIITVQPPALIND